MIGISSSIQELIEQIRACLPSGTQIYLIGGAVRDALLGRDTHDLDFVLAGDSMGIARKIANNLEAAFFPLDEDRKTARLVLTRPDGSRFKLDFAALRGADLESDLRARDFTINALAISLDSADILIDPTGGAADLYARVLRAPSPGSFLDDPVRIIRAVRLATSLNCKLLPETSRQLRQAIPYLDRISPERLRDELFRILEGPQPATGIRLLDILGALDGILPEVTLLKGVSQSPPHVSKVWEHTMEVLKRLEQVLAVLAVQYNQEKASSWALGFISVQLGRYRSRLHDHLQAALNPERSIRGLLFLAALYHDSGKPATRHVEETGRIRFFDHERVSADLAARRGHWLRLSNAETERLVTIVRNHMRPLLLAQAEVAPSRRAIYRYFKATGQAGVDTGLFSLADCLAIYGATLPGETWTQQLMVVRELFEAWWEKPERVVSPPTLLNGHDLIRNFDLAPGPFVGELLEAVREAQATGQINNREQAFQFVVSLLEPGQRGEVD